MSAGANAAELIIEATVPTSVFVDEVAVGQMYVPASLTLSLPAGEHTSVFMINGSPQPMPLLLLDGLTNVVTVGQSGITTATRRVELASASTEVEFRTTSSETLTVHVGEERFDLPPGESAALDLPVGEHTISVRGGAGTVVYGRGTLVVSGLGHLVVQVADGRLPEAVGPGGSFQVATSASP